MGPHPAVQSLGPLGTEKGRLCAGPEPVLGHLRSKSWASMKVAFPESSTQSPERS